MCVCVCVWGGLHVLVPCSRCHTAEEEVENLAKENAKLKAQLKHVGLGSE